MLWNILWHPRLTSREILAEKTIYSSLSVVFVFAVLFSFLFLLSHINADYPPPKEELEAWIDAWGEFSMLPFMKIPAEQYRLAQAIFFTPLTFAIWILMAGSAKTLSILFWGKLSFMQYLNLLGFSFFVFWILGSILDMVYSGFLGDVVLQALQLEYGTVIRSFFVYFPPIMWTGLLGLGGLYNAIAVSEGEHFGIGKTILIGLATFIWPIISISFLIR